MSIKQLSQNHSILIFLLSKGYPLSKIRNALSVLSGERHQTIGDKIGKSRTAVTNALNTAIGSEETLGAIANIFGVPVNELFSDNGRYLSQ